MAEAEHWSRLRAYLSGLRGEETPKAEPDDKPEDKPEEEPDKPKEPEEDPGEPEEPVASRLGRVGKAANNLLPSGLVDRVAGLPAPGGLFPLILVLIFFLLVIVPAGPFGETRLNLLWQGLTGGATVPAGPRRETAQALQDKLNAEGATAVQSLWNQAGQDIASAAQMPQDILSGWAWGIDHAILGGP